MTVLYILLAVLAVLVLVYVGVRRAYPPSPRL